ncbi:MAG TPA: glycosyltransferase [Candidatus Dormibacteraeota bacterium]
MAERLPSTLPRPRGSWPRVAVICFHTSPTAALGHSANGGLNVYVREVCRQFSARGVATDVFTRIAAGPGPVVEQLAPLSRVVYLPAGPAEVDKYELVGYVEEFAGRVARFARDEGIRYDMLYSHYWLSGMVACTLHARWRLPWAHTAHTLAAVKNHWLPPGDTPEPALRERLEGEIARSADLLVVSTQAEGEALRRAYGVPRDRLQVARPGVDLQRFGDVKRFTSEPRTVLFVGRLERLKGADIALSAFAEATAGRPDVRLLVLGGDSHTRGESERRRLDAIAHELGIQDRVAFLGSVPQDQLPAYYGSAEALLMPSYSESFGLVGLEAQACGCPVIAADVAGLASVVRDGWTGFLVAGHDPSDYAQRLRSLLDDPALGRNMGRRGRLLARAFSWERTADRLLAAFSPWLETARPQLTVQAGALTE